MIDINHLTRDILILVRPELIKHQVSLELQLTTDLPSILGAVVQLQQVVLNLTMNGIESMEGVTDRARTLVIRSTSDRLDDLPAVRVTIEDAGTGLAGQEPERVFKPFYTTKPDGLGMGLSISRSLIEAHAGRLWATANPGHGTTFQFVLPALSARAV